jgi:O-antigen ligase
VNKYIGNNLNKQKKYSTSVYLTCFIFIYILFALDRIKNLLAFKVDGITTTNEIWLIPLFYLFTFIINSNKRNYVLNKYNIFISICVISYIIIIIIGGFYTVSVSQYLYAVSLFIIPILIFFTITKFNKSEVNLLIKFFVVVCMVYAIFSIILITNYAYFMNLLGNPIDYRYYFQYRPSMMLGSSITVSYYFNLTLPICFYLFYCSNKKKWKIISALTIVVNIIASFLLLSRIAVICTILIILFYLLFIKIKSKYFNKIMIIILIIFGLIFAFKKYDLSRIFTVFSPSEASISLRLKSANLALNIFKQYPIFGSGMGRFFERAYIYRYITVDGVTGLIDPHNMYLLILSEMGIIGILITIALIFILLKSFSQIKNNVLRKTAYITFFALLFDAIGGSHLFNSISFASVFWIYMGLFSAISIKNINQY